MKNILLYLSILFSTVVIAQNNEQASLQTNIGHVDAITDFDLSRDMKYIVSSGEDGQVILWDFESGKQIKNPASENKMFSTVCFNKDAGLVAYADFDKENKPKHKIIVKNIKNDEIVSEISLSIGNISFLKFINNGLVFGSANALAYYKSIETKELIEYKGFKTGLKKVCISADNKTLLASSENEIFIWDINKIQAVKVIKQFKNIKSIAVNSNGSKIAVSTGDNTVYILNGFTGETIKSIQEFRYPVNAMQFSNDDKFLACSEEKLPDVKLFETANYTLSQTVGDIHKGQVGKIIFRKNIMFTSGSWDRRINAFDIISKSTVRNFEGLARNVYETAYYDNHTFAGGFRKNKIFTAFMSKELKNKIFVEKAGSVSCVALNPERNILAYGTSTKKVAVLEVKTGKLLNEFTNHKSWIRKIVFSKDASLLAVGSFEEIKIWNLKTNKLVSVIAKPVKIPYSIAFSNDNKHLAVGGRNFAVVFNIETAKKEKQYKIKNIAHSVAFSNSGKYLAVGEGNEAENGKFKVYIFDNQASKAVNSFVAANRRITALNFSNDDTELLTASGTKIKIFNFNDAKELLEIQAHKRWINDVRYSRKGDKIISASDDGTVKIWNSKTGKLLLTQIGLEGTNNWLSFTPDGRFNGTEDALKYFYFVKGLQIISTDKLYEKFFTPQLTADAKPTNDNINNISKLPKIEVIDPSADVPVFRSGVSTLLSTDKKEATITAKFEDMGGGINEIRLYKNGKLIKSEKLNVNEKGKTLNKTYNVRLSKGLNIFELASFNNDGVKNSKQIGIEYTGTELDSANLYIVALGINNYKKPAYNLNYAISDAGSFADELQKNSKTLFKSVSVFKVFNNDVTKDSLTNLIDSLSKTANENDVFVFYYAGHGAMSTEENGEKPQFYIIPYDVTNLYSNQMLKEKAISAETIKKWSEKIPAEKQLFVFDACQSGGAVEYLASRGVETEKAISQLAHSTGTYFLSASGSQQLAGEFEQLGHGVFTYAILEALKGKAMRNNKLTVKSLTWFVEEKVPELSEKYKGKPQYPVSYGFGQDFPLIVKE